MYIVEHRCQILMIVLQATADAVGGGSGGVVVFFAFITFALNFFCVFVVVYIVIALNGKNFSIFNAI